MKREDDAKGKKEKEAKEKTKDAQKWGYRAERGWIDHRKGEGSSRTG